MSPDDSDLSWNFGLIVMWVSLSSVLIAMILGYCWRFLRFQNGFYNAELGGVIHVQQTVHETQWPIRGLRTLDGVGSADHDECAICLKCFKETEICWLLVKCGHAFHKSCVENWLKINWSCPLCRAYSVTIVIET